MEGLLGTLESYALNLVLDLYNSIGWSGVVALMAIESTVIPLPSEIVMPLAGFVLVAERGGTFLGVLFAGTMGALGSLIGSLIEYYIARLGGKALILRYGKYILLLPSDIDRAERWFSKNGHWTIFVGRLIPGVRGFISIPAGIGKMNLVKFSIFTFAGAFLWTTLLAWLGYVLGENYDSIRSFIRPVEIPVLVVMAAIIIYFFTHRIVKVRRAYNKK